MLSLDLIARNPSLATLTLKTSQGEVLLFRPLLKTDTALLSQFFAGLSPETRLFYNVTETYAEHAQEHCESIAKYDKLRFVLVNEAGTIIGLLEFSFDLMPGDISRYKLYGIPLGTQDVRFGLCLADAYQAKGIASLAFPYLRQVIQQFGKKRMLLWGGVLKENLRARAFYKKVGFIELGDFINQHGRGCVDALLEL